MTVPADTANLVANVVQTVLLAWLCVKILDQLRAARAESARDRKRRLRLATDQLEETTQQLQVERGSEELLAEVEAQVRALRRLADGR